MVYKQKILKLMRESFINQLNNLDCSNIEDIYNLVDEYRDALLGFQTLCSKDKERL